MKTWYLVALAGASVSLLSLAPYQLYEALLRALLLALSFSLFYLSFKAYQASKGYAWYLEAKRRIERELE